MGTIFELKRFAVHDGGGIRSTLFFKGCPLHCPWCQNPEGLYAARELWHNPTACLHCGACVEVCANAALTLDTRIHYNSSACTLCGKCVDVCPAAAMDIAGTEISAADAAAQLLRDRTFFGTGGGVTLSGGEVLAQAEFARDVLQICKDAGVHTAIETSLFAQQETLKPLLPVTDLWIVDIKYFDAARHLQILGVDNAQILSNFSYLVAQNVPLLVRTPLIPGYTATAENIRAIARYLVHTAPNVPYELLNFNPLCRSKYAAAERDYPVQGGAFSAAEMETFYAVATAEGVQHLIKE